MSSWVKCLCGENISTGSFPNDRVYRLVSEVAFDQLEEPPTKKGLDALMLGSDKVIACSRCGRLIVERAGGQREFFVRDETLGRDR
jgi:hypothetical protein